MAPLEGETAGKIAGEGEELCGIAASNPCGRSTPKNLSHFFQSLFFRVYFSESIFQSLFFRVDFLGLDKL